MLRPGPTIFFVPVITRLLPDAGTASASITGIPGLSITKKTGNTWSTEFRDLIQCWKIDTASHLSYLENGILYLAFKPGMTVFHQLKVTATVTALNFQHPVSTSDSQVTLLPQTPNGWPTKSFIFALLQALAPTYSFSPILFHRERLLSCILLKLPII